MTRPSILWVVVGFAALPQVEAVNAQEASQSDAATWFWQSPQLSLDDVTLSPTKVRLAASPLPDHRYATFEVAGRRASQDFKPSNPTLHRFVLGEQNYRVDVLSQGVNPFVDRKYRVTQLPDAFNGLPVVRTKMGHKSIVDTRFAVILEVSEPVYVFVAIDERAIETYKEFGPPSWLQVFSPTGLRILTDDPIMQQTGSGYTVFAKQSPKGKVVLGSSACDPNNAMYFAFVAAAK